MNTPGSITGDYLSGRKKIPVPQKRRPGNGKHLTVRGAAENNLRHVDISIPLGTFTCVTGVSGSGKSSLVNEILYKKLAADLNHAKCRAGKFDAIEGEEYLDKVIPSAAPPAPTRPPIPDCSTTSGSCSPPPRKPRPGATAPAGSPSMSGGAGARPARGTGC
jgi:excinuclease ABC subunit A